MVRFGRFEDPSGAASYGIAQPDGSFNYAEGCPFAGTLKDTDNKATVSCCLPPVQPAEIICIGLNYRKHADELKLPYPKNPVVFVKPTTTAIGHGAQVVKPRITEKMDYEVELAVIIGKPCKDVTPEQSLDYVLGYTVANDISTRDWQKVPELAGSQWCRSKMFDGFAPLGPVVATTDEIKDPSSLRLQTWLNGQQVQDSNTSDLIFSVQQCISFLSIGTTLRPGTVILTGTPFGVAEGRSPQPWLKPGDKVIVEVEGIGKLENTIVADPSSVSGFHVMSKL
jgi:2-keto-4-pentenoate hydratase/2-oxohepta-3-ene-1,7-dioic acid hydratase in catechol pathway